MRVAVIIPAFNEESRLPAVLEAVTAVEGLSEVWVVSDGSTDRTYEVAAATPGVQTLRMPYNKGKGAAMMAGARAANADAIVFLDADLRGLKPHHVSDLMAPVVEDRADMAVGVFIGGRFLTDMAQRLMPCISGQRCILRSCFLDATHVAELRYGVEMALLKYALEEQLRIKDVSLRGITHPMKEEKLGFIKGSISRAKMYREVADGYLTPVIQQRKTQLQQLIKERLGG